MTNAFTIDPIGAIDRMANKTDRWLFLATLVVLLAVVYFVAKYHVAQHKELITDHKQSRESYQTNLLAIVGRQSENSEKLGGVIASNTIALNNCTEELRNCRNHRNESRT